MSHPNQCKATQTKVTTGWHWHCAYLRLVGWRPGGTSWLTIGGKPDKWWALHFSLGQTFCCEFWLFQNLPSYESLINLNLQFCASLVELKLNGTNRALWAQSGSFLVHLVQPETISRWSDQWCWKILTTPTLYMSTSNQTPKHIYFQQI